MPKQVLFGEEGFRYLCHNLKRRGFRLINHFETRFAIDRLGLVPTRLFKPRTAVLVFTAENLYAVKVRTTYNTDAKSAIQDANGWVMITSGDKRLYTDRPFNRTEGFLDRLILSAALARLRVIYRPNCTRCRAAMEIHKGKYLRQRFWRCPNKCMTMPWDDPIRHVPEAMKLLEKRRKQHKQTDKRALAKGKRPHQKMLKRAANPPWRTTRPQNRLQSNRVR